MSEAKARARKSETATPTVDVFVIAGVEGACLAVNGRRVVGPKPWAGGVIKHEFHVPLSELRAATNDNGSAKMDNPAKALKQAREALDSLWAAVGDRLLGKGPLSKEYAGSVSRQIREAQDAIDAAIRKAAL